MAELIGFAWRTPMNVNFRAGFLPAMFFAAACLAAVRRLDDRRRLLEHDDARITQDRGDLVGVIVVMVVVPQHGDDGHGDIAQLSREDLGLRRATVRREVAGE